MIIVDTASPEQLVLLVMGDEYHGSVAALDELKIRARVLDQIIEWGKDEERFPCSYAHELLDNERSND